MTSRITSLRKDYDIDLYALNGDKIIHYYANPSTEWEYQRQFIFNEFSVKSKVTPLRQGNDIDVYFIDAYNRLFHGWANINTKWAYLSQIIYHEVNFNVDPVAIRFGQNIDLYCVNQQGHLVHLCAGQFNGWKYQSQIIYKPNISVKTLCALRTQENSIDIYFGFGDWIYHGNAKHENKWEYYFQAVANVRTKNQLFCTRYQNNIDVFAVDTKDRLVHFFANDRNEWKYEKDKDLDILTFDGKFSVIRFQENINLYFYGGGGLFYTYVGINSNWKWDTFKLIQFTDVLYDISVVRTPYAIDIFHINQKDKIIHSFIGQATGNNWDKYDSEQLKYSYLCLKPRINWEDICKQCKDLGHGYHSTTFYHKKYGVVKRLRDVNIALLKKEVKILDKLKAYEPELCKYIVYENNKIIGFTIKHFPGKKYGEIISTNKRLYNSRMFRFRVIFQLANQVQKLQKCKVAHSDFSIDNFLIDVDHNFNEYDYDEDIHVKIIDFGNSIDYSQTNSTDSGLTGFQSLWPPQMQKKPYNPKGINPYQFGRTCIHIIKKLYGKQFEVQAHRHRNYQQDSIFLKSLSKNGYNKQFCKAVLTLVSDDASKRLDVLKYFFTSEKLKQIAYVHRFKHLKQNSQARNQFFSKKSKKKQQSQAVWISTGSSKKMEFKDFGIEITDNWREEKKDLPTEDSKTKKVVENTLVNLASNTAFIGPLAGSLVALLFPSQQPDYSLIEDRIGQNSAKDIKNSLYGFKDLIKDFWELYKQQEDRIQNRYKIESKWQTIQSLFIKDKYHFLDKTFGSLIFSDFVAFANAHLLWIKLGIWMHKNWYSFSPRIKQKLDPLCILYVQHGKEIANVIKDKWNQKKKEYAKVSATTTYPKVGQGHSKEYLTNRQSYLQKMKYMQKNQKTYNNLVKTVYDWVQLATEKTQEKLKSGPDYHYVEFDFSELIAYYKRYRTQFK